MSEREQEHHHAQIGLDLAPGYFEVLEAAIRELLVKSNLVKPWEIRRQIRALDSWAPALGTKVVAKAWTDPEFRQRLLRDGRRACEEIGIKIDKYTSIVVLENNVKVHHLITSSLCPCYPCQLLGLPPDWYRFEECRNRAMIEPRAFLAELGTSIPYGVEVRVSHSTAAFRYLVLPMQPYGSENYSIERLAALVTRDAMIGVVPVRLQDVEAQMNPVQSILRPLPHCHGGLDKEPVLRTDYPIEPWQKRFHALTELLERHNLIDIQEEKRRAVASLGSAMIGVLAPYERWAIVFANILFQKGILKPEQVALKMSEIDTRTPAKPLHRVGGAMCPETAEIVSIPATRLTDR